MIRDASRWHLAFLSSAVGAALAGWILLLLSVARVIERMEFDYDLLLWADDYFMTSMLKLAAGVPIYSALSDANSTIYSPGGPYLHYVLLAPFGLDTVLLANRVLNQLWLLVALGLGTAAVMRLHRASAESGEPGFVRGLVAAVAFGVLGLCAYANPVADALHPTNLELCVLLTTMLVLARFDELTGRRRLAATAVLPGLAFLAKQTAGIGVTLALVWCAYRQTHASRSRRLGSALVPVLSLLATLVILHVTSGGLFKRWAFDILAAHHFDWWKVTDIYEGYFLLFVPVVAVCILHGIRAYRRRTPFDHQWLRAASLVVFYAPFALTALFKAMGGPNNLAVVGFLVAVLALPVGTAALLRSGALPVRGLALALIAVQIGLWHPRRRVPDAQDFENARTICEYAAARMRCGERVLLGRGSLCYQRGGIDVPIDRMNSIIEVTVAGRRDELGFYQRVLDQEYDLMIFSVADQMWFGEHLWNIMKYRYSAFYMTEGELEGDFWFHGWQGYVTWPTAFWERIDERGRHSVTDDGMRCDGT